MAVANDGEMTCPQCGHSNPPNSGYCWECRFDLVPNEPARGPIPSPYSNTLQKVNAASDQSAAHMFWFGVVASLLIIAGSWKVLTWIYPSMGVIRFAAGWAAALTLVVLTEKYIPKPASDLNENWWSFDREVKREIRRNRAAREWHMLMFLPGIVLRTLRRGYAMLAPR